MEEIYEEIMTIIDEKTSDLENEDYANVLSNIKHDVSSRLKALEEDQG